MNLEITQEQADLIQMFADGLTRRQVARKLEISIRTVEDRCDKIRENLGCKTIIGVIVMLFRNGLIK